MQQITINEKSLTEGSVLLAQEESVYSLLFSKKGSGEVL